MLYILHAAARCTRAVSCSTARLAISCCCSDNRGGPSAVSRCSLHWVFRPRVCTHGIGTPFPRRLSARKTLFENHFFFVCQIFFFFQIFRSYHRASHPRTVRRTLVGVGGNCNVACLVKTKNLLLLYVRP